MSFVIQATSISIADEEPAECEAVVSLPLCSYWQIKKRVMPLLPEIERLLTSGRDKADAESLFAFASAVSGFVCFLCDNYIEHGQVTSYARVNGGGGGSEGDGGGGGGDGGGGSGNMYD
jgi:uncharacterized membrane protein YgcG